MKRKKPARLVSDGSNNSSESESDASDNGFEDNSSSEDWESDWASETEDEESPPAKSKVKKKIIPGPVPSTSVGVTVLSDSSDGESEKCPICLLSFNTQEVGTPETCDHSFCAECIQEWSKNVNTCPVDRQTFSLILVRKRYNGKVIRRVAVDVRRPSVDELIQEDPTYCEVCGMSDREDRLLLCDGCDLGYHLECLDPPMDTVPIEEWFCSECRIPTMLRDLEQAENSHSRRPRTEPRLLPRTSQSERVRATIETNRNFVLNVDQNSVSSGFEDTALAGSSRSGSSTITRAARTTTTKTTRKKRRKTRRKRAPGKILYYEINEKTGEKVAVRKKCKRRRKKKRRKKSNRRVVQPRTVKKRLAFQLGMCPPKKAGLAIPEVKVKTHQNHIGFQRSQAGIPTLHLFGQRDQIDYFSGSEEEFDVAGAAGVNIMSQARTATSEINAMRRAARRKAVFAPEPPTSVSSCDILGSILDSQTKLHSKHSVISVTRDGTLHIENKSSRNKTEKNNNLIKPNNEAESIATPASPPLDVTSSNDVEVTQAPMFPGRGGGGNRQPYGFHRGGGGGGGGGGYRSGYDSGSNYNHFQGGGISGPRGRGGYGSNMYNNQRDNSNYGGGYMNYYHGGPPPFRGRGGPPRFPMRRPPMQQHQQPPPPVRVPPVELVLDDPPEENQPERDCQPQQPEEEVDIYSDIEAGSPVPEEDTSQLKPPVIESQPQPALVAQVYNNSGTDDDSDSELVIDDSVKETDKYDPADPSNDTDSNSAPSLNKEKSSSSVKEVEKLNISSEPTCTPVVVEENVSTITENSTTAATSVIQKTKLSNYSPKIVNEVVQQVLKEHLSHTPSSSKQNDDDEISDDDCPNFSIYSAASIDIAKSTDLSVNIPKEDNSATPPENPEDKEQSIYENEEELEVKNERTDAEKTEENDTINASSKVENVDMSDESCDNMSKEDIKLKSSENSNMVNDENEESQDAVKEEEECAVSVENDDDDNDIKDTVKQSEVKMNKDESIEDDAESLKVENENDISKSDNDDDDDSNDESLNTLEAAIDEPNFDNKDDIKKSPKPDDDESVVVQRADINDSSAPTTPPLPSKPQTKVEQKPSPIKIAFNPNRKICLADHSKKERVLQLYDDSDLEEWECKDDFTKEIKPDAAKPNDVSEIEKMTEAISEEERSYTPCLDEKEPSKHQYSDDEHNTGGGIGGLDTEMISDEERNDMFDESHDMKTISDGDALEINAKESELDLARPEDYEEGEIVEKLAAKKSQDVSSEKTKESTTEDDKKKRIKKKPEKEVEKEKVKEGNKQAKKPEFKKLSKSNKERNYRDKEKARSRSKEKKGKENKENRRDKTRKEKKKDLERYNVRSLIAEKPKKDQFGRDIDRSPSRSSRSATPTRRSTSRPRRSDSWDKTKKRRRRTRSPRRSRSRSLSRAHVSRSRSRARSPRRSRSFRRSSRSPRRSRSRSFRRSRSPRNKRYRPGHRSASRERYRNRSRRRSAERPRTTKKKNRSVSRPRVRSRTPSPPKHRTREWERAHSYSREWTPSWSRSPSPRPVPRHTLPQSMSPSWTPPVAIEKGPVQPENLTVILTNNEVNKTKKKDKKKKADKKSKDEYRKRKRTDRTPPPSKEVFASGDNILVSVSFNKTSEENTVATREVMGVKRKRDSITETNKKNKKDKATKEKKKRAKSPKTRKKNKEVANMKPVAIIDLDRSPFKEITPSPKDIIVLSDSDNCEKEDGTMGHHDMMQEEEEEMLTIDAQNQEDSAPQSPTSNYLNSTGPKTPPEPQVKFLLSSKQTQLRAISNPLHDPNDEGEGEIDPQEELEHRLEDVLHKGPNTPPEPPSSPPSSPDAYDPFDPTKSRSPTPEPQTTNQQVSSAMNTPGDKTESDGDLVDLAVGPLESNQKNTGSINENVEKRSGSLDQSKRLSLSPERTSQTRTPPTTGTETESESAKGDSNDKNGKSPERNSIGVVINQQVQPQFPAVVKPIQPTAVYSSITPSIITSTPASSNAALPRANLFNTPSTVGGTPRMVPTSVPQRIILPTPAKSSPAKMSPLKSSPSKPPIKSTPIKPMPSKTMISKLPVPNVKPVTPIRKGGQVKAANRSVGQNGNEVIDVDLDFESPYSPGSSDYEDLFEPPVESTKNNSSSRTQQQQPKNTTTKSPAKQNTFDNLFGSSPVFRGQNNKSKSKSNAAKVPVKMNKKPTSNKGTLQNELPNRVLIAKTYILAATNKTQVGVKVDEDNLKILDDLPNSAVEMQVKDKVLFCDCYRKYFPCIKLSSILVLEETQPTRTSRRRS